MAAHPVVTVEKGFIAIPDELRDDPRFRDGARLQRIPLVSEPERAEAWREFKKLRGILKDSDYDPNAELEAEKQRELADERR